MPKSFLCPICYKGFTRSNDMKRHRIKFHPAEVLDTGPYASVSKQNNEGWNTKDRCNSFQLVHPFTCMVAGMTGCGKTVWVRTLLEQAQKTISLPPQRIVWCFSQWQPAYTALVRTVPGIEFVKGIPRDLEQDHYFDVRVRNMLVIDDQMTEAGKDPRISNLFTKGSHHRNLSVVYIVQNLFHQGKSSRSISLNSHYLVLFKNPRDKLQVFTLAKQMYPRQTDYFLDQYEEAVKRPYGYLFVDLKPNTPEGCRLRMNVLPGEKTTQEETTEDKISKELLKYLKQQGMTTSPVVQTMQHIQDNMDGVLQQSDLGPAEKVIKYTQLQNEFLRYKQQMRQNPSSRTTPVRDPPAGAPDEAEMTNTPQPTVAELVEPATVPYSARVSPIMHHSPEPLHQPSFQSPDVTSFPLTPPPTVLPSTPLPKRRKRERVKLKNYLDDDADTTLGPYGKERRTRRILRSHMPPYKGIH